VLSTLLHKAGMERRTRAQAGRMMWSMLSSARG